MTHSELSERLGRPAFWISRMRKHFGLPALEEYPECYETLLRKVRDLRNLGVSEERPVNLWNLERKLIDILHLGLGGVEFSLLSEKSLLKMCTTVHLIGIPTPIAHPVM
jgi:hypothetical protein